MLKAAGALLIAFSGAAAGFSAAGKRRMRLTYLEDMIQSVGAYKTSVTALSLPVPEAIKQCGKGLAERALRGDDAFLKEEDRRELAVFLDGLSARTEEGQIGNACRYENRLCAEEATEREQYLKEAKLLRGGGVLAGLLVAVLLL